MSKHIDIKPYMNAQTIAYDDIDALLPNIDLPKTIGSGHVRFKLERNNEGKDAVCCNGQRITINCRVKAIHLLGFCIWGGYKDYIKFIYTDSRTEYKEFGFADTYWETMDNPEHLHRREYQLCRYDCKPVKEYRKNAEAPPTRIYSTSIMAADNDISQLILPVNEFVHIMAIAIDEA